MDRVNKSEDLITQLIASIINNRKHAFLGNGLVLASNIERVYGDGSYESEVYVLLKCEGDVLELYPVQVVLALKDEEPIVYVDEDNRVGLEKEICTEIDQWQEKYLAKTSI
ncbi:MAG TPA: hypothetical protein VGK02_00915 [Candidatus Aquicultor sp.]